MNIEIKYKKKISDQEINLVENISRKYAKIEIQKKGSSSGAIDLVTILEFTFGHLFIKHLATPILENYRKGLINEEYFQELGNKHRTSLMDKFSNISPYFNEIFSEFIKEKQIENESISLIEKFEKFQLYVCLNEKRMTEELFNDFPSAITNTFSIIELGLIEIEEPKVVQLYPDFEKQIWDYLFIPSFNGFGKFIDRYYCFSENKMHYISSAEEFIDKFKIEDLDEYKLIISPRI